MSTPCYVYAVIRDDEEEPFGTPLDGLDGAPVERVAYGDVTALVSAYEDSRVRSSRANLSAHEAVVEAARGGGQRTVLPMRFGVVVPSKAAVVDDYLRPQHVRLSLLLAELAGKVEFRVQARYMPDVALRQVVRSSRSIQRVQTQIRARPEASTYHARIQLGEMVAAGLDEVKAQDARYILDWLVPHCALAGGLDPLGDDVAVRLALLVQEDRVADFQQAVDQLANELEGRLKLALVGPLAPWDFVDLELTAGR